MSSISRIQSVEREASGSSVRSVKLKQLRVSEKENNKYDFSTACSLVTGDFKMNSEASRKKSPLQTAPLRQAGESLQTALVNAVLEKMVLPLIVTLFLGYSAYSEISALLGRKPSLVYAVAVTIAFIGYGLFAWTRWLRFKPQIDAMKLGRDGEKMVSELFADHIRKGRHVFHDVVGSNFNLDHVIVAKEGIFVIETKTISKPNRSDAAVSFDGTSILVDGRKLDRDPLKQVLAQIGWLDEILRESTGRDFPVKGIVVFPGWFVNSSHSNVDRKVWVMNPKNVDGFISAGQAILPPDAVQMAAFHLKSFIQSADRANP